MNIKIDPKQMEGLKYSYKKKYVDDSELYKSPKMGEGINQNLNKLTFLDLLGKFSELTRKYKDVFQKEENIGEGEDGSPVVMYTLDKHKGKERPILMIVGGVHGDEKTSIYGIYETVKILLDDNKWSKYITNTFIVQIVPCLNVYGFNHNKRNNSNDKDLNRDFEKKTQKEVKALTTYISKNKKRVEVVLDSHNAYNDQFISCKAEMGNFSIYEDIAFKLNLFLNGNFDSDDKRTFLWVSRSKNSGTLSDFVNKNGIAGHTVESPRSLVKEIHYPNPVNYEDGAEVTKDLLVNLMYIYGHLEFKKRLDETLSGKKIPFNNLIIKFGNNIQLVT